MNRVSVVVVVLAATSVVSCSRQEQPVAAKPQQPRARPAAVAPAVPPTQGGAMPDYKAALLDGSTFSTSGERGNVVLLNLWATWCGPCRAEIPALLSLQSKYGKRGFKVVGISLDEVSDESAVRDFVREQKITYPIAMDKDKSLTNAFQVSVLPTSMLIDRDGKIVWQDVGMLTKDDPRLVAAIETSLSGKAALSGQL